MSETTPTPTTTTADSTPTDSSRPGSWPSGSDTSRSPGSCRARIAAASTPSSRSPRCSASRLEIDDRLAEGTPIEQSWELVSEVALETVVLCSHGDVIPDIIRRAQLRGMHVPGKSGSSKGSAWTLRHWDGERFATGLYTPIKP